MKDIRYVGRGIQSSKQRGETKTEQPVIGCPVYRFVSVILDNYDVLRLQAFLAFDDGEFYTLTFIQITVSISNDGIVMDE